MSDLLINWNKDFKRLKAIIYHDDCFKEAIQLSLKLHALVHSEKMSGINHETLEDQIWEGLDERSFREKLNSKGRTVAYGIWHSSRIEDITMNLLVDGKNQILNEEWLTKINSPIKDTGNALSKEEILRFSMQINREELQKYRMAVGRRTQEIFRNLKAGDFKRKLHLENISRILNEGAVLEENRWLIDYWSKKDVAGIILMPGTRHHVVHINESLQSRNKK